MIQVGKPSFIGVTMASGLRVGARVLKADGTPVSAWMLMNNYDGNSYGVEYTYAAAGAYGVKKVVFLNSDTDFTARDGGYPEADDAVQVVDVAALVLDVAASAHSTAGTIGGSIGAGGSAGGPGPIGIIAGNPGPIIGVVGEN